MTRAWASLATIIATIGTVFAQTPADAWLATAEARAFRDRVVALALIYGDSSGIDPRGFKVEARKSGEEAGCAKVEVRTWIDREHRREEHLRVCDRHETNM
jgi:hypothetical protein